MIGLSPETLAYTAVALIVAATIHEFAHAYAAVRLGDPTPQQQGRLTLNPLAHLDPIGSLMIFLVGFGWARPVEIQPANFSDWRRGVLLVAVAGPLANVAAVALLGLPVRLGSVPPAEWAVDLWSAMIRINAVLAVFNLLPIPPLDGSRILASLLPGPYAVWYARLQPIGIVVLVVLLFTGSLGRILTPPVLWLIRWGTGLPL
ncbi:MAG: site-2 protease family protein [Armatimonadota bacterium]|nr:site-2 protease family protein [Armatimonadota bacterium]MDR5697218.1 site-2 protease family protein [Armatimonadota bacterium]